MTFEFNERERYFEHLAVDHFWRDDWKIFKFKIHQEPCRWQHATQLDARLTIEKISFGYVRQVAFGIKSAMCGTCKQKCVEVLRNVWQTWRQPVINVNFVKRFYGRWCRGVFRLPSGRQRIPTCIVGECFLGYPSISEWRISFILTVCIVCITSRRPKSYFIPSALSQKWFSNVDSASHSFVCHLLFNCHLILLYTCGTGEPRVEKVHKCFILSIMSVMLSIFTSPFNKSYLHELYLRICDLIFHQNHSRLDTLNVAS